MNSLFKRLTWAQEKNDDIRQDIKNGHQIGMYKVSDILGSGNFSKVKLAFHLITGGSDDKVI